MRSEGQEQKEEYLDVSMCVAAAAAAAAYEHRHPAAPLVRSLLSTVPGELPGPPDSSASQNKLLHPAAAAAASPEPVMSSKRSQHQEDALRCSSKRVALFPAFPSSRTHSDQQIRSLIADKVAQCRSLLAKRRSSAHMCPPQPAVEPLPAAAGTMTRLSGPGGGAAELRPSPRTVHTEDDTANQSGEGAEQVPALPLSVKQSSQNQKPFSSNAEGHSSHTVKDRERSNRQETNSAFPRRPGAAAAAQHQQQSINQVSSGACQSVGTNRNDAAGSGSFADGQAMDTCENIELRDPRYENVSDAEELSEMKVQQQQPLYEDLSEDKGLSAGTEKIQKNLQQDGEVDEEELKNSHPMTISDDQEWEVLPLWVSELRFEPEDKPAEEPHKVSELCLELTEMSESANLQGFAQTQSRRAFSGLSDQGLNPVPASAFMPMKFYDSPGQQEQAVKLRQRQIFCQEPPPHSQYNLTAGANKNPQEPVSEDSCCPTEDSSDYSSGSENMQMQRQHLKKNHKGPGSARRPKAIHQNDVIVITSTDDDDDGPRSAGSSDNSGERNRARGNSSDDIIILSDSENEDVQTYEELAGHGATLGTSLSPQSCAEAVGSSENCATALEEQQTYFCANPCLDTAPDRGRGQTNIVTTVKGKEGFNQKSRQVTAPRHKQRRTNTNALQAPANTATPGSEPPLLSTTTKTSVSYWIPPPSEDPDHRPRDITAPPTNHAREKVCSDWHKSFNPTRRDRRARASEQTQQNIDVADVSHNRACRRKRRKHTADRGPHKSQRKEASHRSGSQSHDSAPLMKKTKHDAIEYTKARNWSVSSDARFPVGQGYKWKSGERQSSL